MDLQEQSFLEVSKNETIRKYNQLYSIDILKFLGYSEGFRWSNYFLLVAQLSGTYDQINLENMYGVDLLGFSARLLDDFLDKDTLLYDIIGPDHLSLLSTELLVESLEMLSKNNFFDFQLLKEALDAEFVDYTNRLSLESSIDFYFKKIIPKSTALFRLNTKLASKNDSQLDKFATHYGTFLQLRNDIAGILTEHSSDIAQKKNSLPLIASTNTSDSNSDKDLMMMLSNKSISSKIIQDKVIQTGALNFCNELMVSEKELALSRLNHFGNISAVNDFIQYLKLGN